MQSFTPSLSKFALTVSLLGAVVLAGHVSSANAQAVPNEVVPAVVPASQAAIDAFLASHPNTSVSIRGGNITRVYGRTFAAGTSPIGTADAFVSANAAMFGVTPANLPPIGPFPDGARVVPLVYDSVTDSYKFNLVTYSQFLNGLPVFRADLRVLVRNEAGFPAVQVSSSLKDLGAFATNFKGGPISPSSIDQGKLMRSVRSHFQAAPKLSALEAVIWAGVDEQPETPRLAYKFVAQGGSPVQPDSYQKVLYVVDAATGRVLFNEDQICNVNVTGSVTGMATVGSGADICGNEVSAGMPYSKVAFGATTAYADVNGNFTATGVAAGQANGTSKIEGLYFIVNDSATAVETITSPISGGVANFVHNAANSDALIRAQTNAYIQANVIHDLVLAQNPAYPVISGQSGANAFTINTNLASTCNAFYDGASINFYQAGGGCSNTSFSTVVHHEYGHHVVQSGGSGQGGYGEGMGDCMGILTVDESITGFGFQNNCAAGIRDANNTCQYSAGSCSSCGSEVHACGMLISGCVWDLRTNWAAAYPGDYRQRLASIVINSVPLHSGSSTINNDITIDYLTLDDDNADITDGTPNYTTIADAFNQHGLTAPAIQLLKFTFPDGVPTNVNPNGSTNLKVNVSGVAGTPQPGSGKFFYRTTTGGAFTQLNMTQLTPNNYTVAIPSSTCLSTLQFYVQAASTTNQTQTSPSSAPTATYSAVSAASTSTVFADSMEISSVGWQAGVPGDTATTGQWVRVDPNGTAAQPEDDHTAAGTQCWVTGQGSVGGALGEADIDGGTTTLVSPTFDATGFDAAYVSYWRWYSNDTGASPNADTMPVEISNNNGTTWTVLETVSDNSNAWVFKSFKISDFVTPSATMKMRWRASDLGSGSVVEAGVDDVTVSGYKCVAANPADLNGDGHVDAADLAIMLGAWGTAGPGDLNGDGIVAADDLAMLLGAFN